MRACPLETPRFVRRTRLGPGEYRKHFRQIDGDVIAAVTSREADRITPLMSKIYLRLVHAPADRWEHDGVLRFEGELHADRHVTAWTALCEVLGVASATASKALRWMHEQGIIGYFAGKNGVGIRIFLNRAAASIGVRSAGQKILAFAPASTGAVGASTDEAGFRDSFAGSESSETDRNPRAPNDGAGDSVVGSPAPSPQRYDPVTSRLESTQTTHRRAYATAEAEGAEGLTDRLLRRLEPAVRTAAAQAAAREHERTREWLESRGLPKAARVAQREAYNVLRQYGLITTAVPRPKVGAEVGRSGSAEPVSRRGLSAVEVRELAETCVAMLEVHGQAVEVTLAQLSAEAGGVLRAEEAPRVRELALALVSEGR